MKLLTFISFFSLSTVNGNLRNETDIIKTFEDKITALENTKKGRADADHVKICTAINAVFVKLQEKVIIKSTTEWEKDKAKACDKKKSKQQWSSILLHKHTPASNLSKIALRRK